MYKNLTTIKERICYYIDFKKISKNKFYEQSGVTYGILNQASNISADNIQKVLVIYPDLNAEWLICGRGEMIKKETIEVVEIEKIVELIVKHGDALKSDIKNLNKNANLKIYKIPSEPLAGVADPGIEIERKKK